MTRSDFLRNAAWVGKATRYRNTFTVLRGAPPPAKPKFEHFAID